MVDAMRLELVEKIGILFFIVKGKTTTSGIFFPRQTGCSIEFALNVKENQILGILNFWLYLLERSLKSSRIQFL